MSAIPFTDRELRNAWRDLSTFYQFTSADKRKNPHRLLLFYAVECGLKAVWLKRQHLSLLDNENISKTGHDLRKVLKELNVGAELSLPESLQLDPINRNGVSCTRQGDIRVLHQIWRYGGTCITPTDSDCEQQLWKILNWIQGELK